MVLHADALWLLLQGERMLRVSQHSARPPSHAGQAQRPSLLVPYTTQAAGPFRKRSHQRLAFGVISVCASRLMLRNRGAAFLLLLASKADAITGLDR